MTTSVSNFDAFSAYSFIFVGCVGNMCIMESFQHMVANTSIFLTLIQFLFVSMFSFVYIFSYGIACHKVNIVQKYGIYLPKSRLSYSEWVSRAILNFFTSVAANWAFKYMTVPVQVISRSATVIATVLVERFYRKKKFVNSQLYSAACAAIGVFLASTDPEQLTAVGMAIYNVSLYCVQFIHGILYFFLLGSKQDGDVSKNANVDLNSIVLPATNTPYWYPYVGGLLILCSLISQAFMSALQDDILNPKSTISASMKKPEDKTTAKIFRSQSEQSLLIRHDSVEEENPEPIHWSVALFYSHFFALPFFLLVSHDIFYPAKAIVAHYQSNVLGMYNIYMCLIAYGVTQFICVAGVYQLKKVITDPLYISIVLNLRKIITVAVSVIMYEHKFSWLKFIGALLVLITTISYKKPQTPDSRSKAKGD